MLRNGEIIDQKRVGRVVAGVIGVVVAAGYLVMAAQMPFGRPAAPGAGMFPIGVGIAGIAISVLVVAEAALTTETSGKLPLPAGGQIKLVVGFFVMTTAFVLVLPFLGQYVAATIFLMAMMRFLGGIAWWKVVVYGLVAGIGTSWVFIEVLNVRLPTGVFG